MEVTRSASEPVSIFGRSLDKEEDLEAPAPVARLHSEPVMVVSAERRHQRFCRVQTASDIIGDNLRDLSNLIFKWGQKNKNLQCVVCFDTFAAQDMFAMVNCTAKQKHTMCNQCTRCYFAGRVTEGRVNDLRCPLAGSDDCQAVATVEEIKDHLSADDFAKYERFVVTAQDPSLRECPQCSELVKPTTRNERDADVVVESQMVCSSGHVFCFYHSNAHPPTPGACEAYSRIETGKHRALMTAYGAKACPKCGAMTEKHSGCNQMNCPACQAKWCWVCGQVLEHRASSGWHYNPANPSGCLQFIDIDDSANMKSSMMLAVRFLSLPGTLLGLFAFWGVLPLWIILCCIGMGISLTLLILFSFAWLPVGMLFSCLLAPCGLKVHEAELLMVAPWLSCWASVECLFGDFE